MDQKTLEQISKRYQDEGYDVIIRPQQHQLPTFLEGSKIDMIAQRGNEGVVVEVKTNRNDVASDPWLTRMAEIVDAHPGWRLDLLVLAPVTAIERAAQEATEPSDEQLAQILNAAEELVDKGYAPYAHIVAWGGLEAVMRRIWEGPASARPTAPPSLMRTLYSDGFLSREQFDRLRESYKIRTQVAHGLVPPRVDADLVRFVTATARHLANDHHAVASSN